MTSMRIKATRGLDLAIAGAPEQSVTDGREIRTVAQLGLDSGSPRPVLAVGQGDRVRRGQALFNDRRHPEIRYTSPASGRVLAIHHGPRRRLLSVVVEVDDAPAVELTAHDRGSLAALPAEVVRRWMLESGLWPTLRARPFDRVPAPGDEPQGIVVMAIDTNPLAADPAAVIGARMEAFGDGLTALGRLCERVFVCRAPGLGLPGTAGSAIRPVDVEGPHPAGLPGTQIARLAPVTSDRQTWHIGYQDVIAIGQSLVSGQLANERVIALGGPGALRPRLVRTRAGAALSELTEAEVVEGARIVAGSVLTGRLTTAETAYLGRHDTQVTALGPEPARRPAPDIGTTAQRPVGRAGPMLPLERFERIWPFPTPVLPLLRALLVEDLDTAQSLGCLGLAEEDLALCEYLCPGRQDYGGALRGTLRRLQAELAP